MEEIVILGAGVAGLSCLNYFLDRGLSPLLIEAGTIGSFKVCGEFLTPYVAAMLEKWSISSVQPIKQATFFVDKRCFEVPFKMSAGSISRSQIELELAARARQKGGRIEENCSVQKLIPPVNKNPYLLHLSSGQEIRANTIFFAVGKFSQDPNTFPYIAVGGHFNGVIAPHCLSMYSIKGAYLGVVPISAEVSNIAGLARREWIEQAGSWQSFLSSLGADYPQLQPVLTAVDLGKLTWAETRVGRFGVRDLPNWPGAYWIGDSLMSFPPSSGSGFSHSMLSANLAVECFFNKRIRHYQKLYVESSRLKWLIAMGLHQALMRPSVANVAATVFDSSAILLRAVLSGLELK